MSAREEGDVLALARVASSMNHYAGGRCMRMEFTPENILAFVAALATKPQAPQGDVTDARRLNWLERGAKINSAGTSDARPALFTILPAWDQGGAAYLTLRDSIDAVMEIAAAKEQS